MNILITVLAALLMVSSTMAMPQNGYAEKPPCTKTDSGYAAVAPTNSYDNIPYSPVGQTDAIPVNNNYNPIPKNDGYGPVNNSYVPNNPPVGYNGSTGNQAGDVPCDTPVQPYDSVASIPYQPNQEYPVPPPQTTPCSQSSPTQVYDQQQVGASPVVQGIAANNFNSAASTPTAAASFTQRGQSDSKGNVGSFSSEFSAAVAKPNHASLVAMCLVIVAGLFVL